MPLNPAEAVSILDRAPAQATFVDKKSAISMTLASHNGGAGVWLGTHIEPVVAPDINDAMLLSRHDGIRFGDFPECDQPNEG